MGRKTMSDQASTLLELVLRVQGDLRRALAPIGVTPLQAGVLCYLRQHADARLVDAAAAFRVEPPTIVDVKQDLVRKVVGAQQTFDQGSAYSVLESQSRGRSACQKDRIYSRRGGEAMLTETHSSWV